ncbi:hypothetical protein FHG87_008875 [Trinorchestia longiramus]|nr:hypothetical protein FHG87_008875 [Trinorchestia longiramus]
MIVRSGKPHTIGEQLILPVIEEVLETMVHHASPWAVTKSIPLSNNSVQRRVDEMSEDVEDILCNILKRQFGQFGQFGVQLDESTLPNNEALLSGYVRFIKSSAVVQELLFAKELETDTRVEFLQENKFCALSDDLIVCKSNIAYLTDAFDTFNDLNLQLQCSDLNLIKAKSKIWSFIDKLTLFRNNIGRQNFSQFPNLSELENEEFGKSVHDDDILIYSNHLNSLHEDLNRRYQDLVYMEVPDWLLNPFTDAWKSDNNSAIQEELLAVKNDFELKPLFKKSYHEFWLQREFPEKHPKFWEVVKLYFLAFSSSYMAERGFNAVTQLLSKQRNRLQIVQRGDLRLLLSSIEPRIDELVRKHQAHPSH